MGVLGLWQLLQPTSRPLKLQGLEGKKLAIDISIWLYQATKGSHSSRNSHIAVLYSRICKLLYFKIKPIFVFDGPNVPKLKERVLQNRQRRRNAAANKVKESDDKLKKNLLESYALQTVLGVKLDSLDSQAKPSTSATAVAEATAAAAKKPFMNDDIFILPEKSEFDKKVTTLEEDLNDEVDEISSAALIYSQINPIEIDKEVLESLPADIQYEILANYKQTLKSKKSQSYEEFPEKSEDFSQFQMKSLLHKSQISNQMNNLKDSMKVSYAMDSEFDKVYHQKVASEDHDEVILLTKKTSTSKLFSQKNPAEIIQLSDDIELINDNEEISLAKKSPQYRIEFNEKNKIEMVPIVKSNLSNNLPIQNNYSQLKSTQSMESISQTQAVLIVDELKKNENIKEKEEEVIADEMSILNEIAENEKNFSLLPKDDSLQYFFPKEMQKPKTFQSEIELIQIEEEEEYTEIKEAKQIVSSETDDDDDDFVEVIESIEKTLQPVDLIKEVDMQICSQIARTNQPIESISPKPLTQIDQNNKEKKLVNEPIIVDNDEAEAAAEAAAVAEEYNSYLMNERNEILREKQANERLSHSLEPHVIEDAQRLLQLFGLPYLRAPGEAEAQCAYLDYTNVTEGTITEDSDVWLFGARRVYKNFFSTDQFIDSYSHQIIKSQLGLDRESLIAVAFLVGSDYTEGVENVGIVKAVEILQEFEGQGFEKLKNFKEWHSKSQGNSKQKQPNKLRTLLAKLKLSESFPSELVYQAYMSPDVDKSSEEFSWSLPDLDMLRKFLVLKMAWTNKKVDDDLLPVIRRINETNIQKTIDSYFACETTSSLAKQSKRMKNAIKSFKSKAAPAKSNNENKNNNNNELNLSEEDNHEIEEIPVQAEKTTSTKLKKTRAKVTKEPKRNTRTTNQPKTSSSSSSSSTTLTANINTSTSECESVSSSNASSSSSRSSSKRKSTESTSIKNKHIKKLKTKNKK